MLTISSKIKDYSVHVVNDILDKKDLLNKVPHSRCFFFIDKQVYALYEKQLTKFIGDDLYVLIDARESNKEYTALLRYYELLIENKFTRSDLLVTIGGGILQDISGFIASTLYRGLRWAFIPTTLLAQADSCIGSKTSINLGKRKNMIGTFYPPDIIFIDTGFCATLTDGYFNSGLGEIIKFHLQSDMKGYKTLKTYLAADDPRSPPLLKRIILSTLKIKQSYFEEDEFDSGRRNLLNYGHCFGHALESASDFSVNHGEAVIVGMGFANLVSLHRGIIMPEKYREFEEILKKHYPRFDFDKISADDIITYLKQDKKRVGNGLTMILSGDVGKQCKYNDLDEEEVKRVFDEFRKKYPKTSAVKSTVHHKEKKQVKR
jgi:3-dehydroquinate synthase